MFRIVSMVLFVAYPSVSIKIFRLFSCTVVDGKHWLTVDVRLQCYNKEWWGYAAYGLAMLVMYVLGLPLTIFLVLWRHRGSLFGPASGPTRTKFGFLYESYTAAAWGWEIEELVRKLLLTAVAVLLDPGSPLQVTVAIVVCGVAHVLHATYKPWGQGTHTYYVQHLSLFVTTFIFLMGLLFKVRGVDQSDGAYAGMAAIMLLLCILFGLVWVAAMVHGVASALVTRRAGARGCADAATGPGALLMATTGRAGAGLSVDRVAWRENPLMLVAAEAARASSEAPSRSVASIRRVLGSQALPHVSAFVTNRPRGIRDRLAKHGLRLVPPDPPPQRLPQPRLSVGPVPIRRGGPVPTTSTGAAVPLALTTEGVVVFYNPLLGSVGTPKPPFR